MRELTRITADKPSSALARSPLPRCLARIATVTAAAAMLPKTVGMLATRANHRRSSPTGGRALPNESLVVAAADGATLAVTVEGTGPPVVLLHGWAADRSIWDAVADSLVEAGLRVVRYDMRGHGRSTGETGDLSIKQLVDDLRRVLDATGVQGAVAVGHSLGSLTLLAHLAAGDVPDRAVGPAPIRAAVLASAGLPDPAVGPRAAAVAAWAMRSPTVEWLIARPTIGLALMDPFSGADRIAAHVEAQRAAFLATPPDVRSRLLATIAYDPTPSLSAYETPTLLLVGSNDRFAVPARVRQLAALLPPARIEVIEGRGHNLPYEVPERIVAAVHSFATL